MMEFCLFSANLSNFVNERTPEADGQSTIRSRVLTMLISDLKLAPDAGSSPLAARLVNKLDGYLFAHEIRDGMRQRACTNSALGIRLWHGITEPSEQYNALCEIEEQYNTDGLLKRLATLCGGFQNVTVHLKMDLGVDLEEDKMSVDFKEIRMQNYPGIGLKFGQFFTLNESLAEKWQSQAGFRGRGLSLCLKFNGETLNLVHLATLTTGELVHRKLLDQAKSSGDGVLLVKNWKEVYCHQIFLSAQSEIFKAMLSSGDKVGNRVYIKMPDISVEGAKAMLAYLYSCDLKEPLCCSWTTVELLRIGDKYGVARLFKAMKEIVLSMENGWFGAGSALELVAFVWAKGNAQDFKELNEKVNSLLESKVELDWNLCLELHAKRWEIQENLKSLENVRTLIELFKVADLHEISWLMDTIKGLICKEENDKFCIMDGVQLLLMAKEQCGFNRMELEQKAIAVLNSKPKEELWRCYEYRILFNRNADVANSHET